MPPQVAAFTDSYLPTINGVTYTVRSWRDRWLARGGRMAVVYPDAPAYDPDPDEHPIGSVRFPLYDGYRLSSPRIPADCGLADADVVHAHTPFGLGLAAWRLGRRADLPLVASYHTPTAEYARYLAPSSRLRLLERAGRRGATGYERWFYEHADVAVVPSRPARRHLRERIGVETPIRVVPTGVDTDRFRPVDATAFRARHGLEGDGPLIGYTGRHGYEKRLEHLLEAVADGGRDGRGAAGGAGLGNATLALAGDGPARSTLERRAADLYPGLDVRFLGFLDRADLPAFYSALDVFAFPSPVETLGLVAHEAIACGTPVVAVDAGALAETVTDGETGFHYRSGNLRDFRRALERALTERERLEAGCLGRRDELGLERSMDRLRALYRSVSS